MTTGILTWLVLILLYLLAAFFCCTETAFTSINRTRLKELGDDGNKHANVALRLLENSSSFFATVLMGTNLVQVTITTLVQAALASLIVKSPWFHHLAELIHFQGNMEGLASSLVVTPTLLIFSEILPKTIGRNNAEPLTLAFAQPTRYMGMVLAPCVFFIDRCSRRLASLFGVKKASEEIGRVSRDDLKLLAHVAAEEGVIRPEASQLMTALLELDMNPVNSVMVPLVELKMLPLTATIGDVIALASETGYTRFPVYEDRTDDVVGLVSLRECLRRMPLESKGENLPISRIVDKNILFVPEARTIGDLLNDFTQSRQPMAMVIDEYGGVVGAVTVEVLLETLTGGIGDFRNQAHPLVRELSAGIYLCDGRLELTEFEEILHVHGEYHGYDTLAGLCLHLCGRIPHKNETMHFHGYDLKVLDVKKHRIVTVLVTFRPSSAKLPH